MPDAVLGELVACLEQRGVVPDHLQREAGQLAGKDLDAPGGQHADHVARGDDAQLFPAPDHHRIVLTLDHHLAQLVEGQPGIDAKRCVVQHGGDPPGMQEEGDPLVAHDVSLGNHAEVAPRLVDHQQMAYPLLTEAAAGLAEGDVGPDRADRRFHEGGNRLLEIADGAPVAHQRIALRPDTDRHAAGHHDDGTAARLAHALGGLADRCLRRALEQVPLHEIGDGIVDAHESRLRYSTASTSISRQPEGLWKRTRSPSRALSRARASGDTQLMCPRAMSVSSTPTIR